MSENKDYVSLEDEKGTVNISEDVIASIAALTAVEVPGVSELAATIGSDIAAGLRGKKNLSRGVRIEVLEGAVSVNVYAVIQYGYAVTKVAKTVQENIAVAIESTTGLKVSEVNVHVGGITFEKSEKNTTHNK